MALMNTEAYTSVADNRVQEFQHQAPHLRIVVRQFRVESRHAQYFIQRVDLDDFLTPSRCTKRFWFDCVVCELEIDGKSGKLPFIEEHNILTRYRRLKKTCTN